MKQFLLTFAFLISCGAVSAQAAERYVEGKILRTEICDVSGGSISLLLTETTGTSPAVGSGCSNSGSFPILRVATSASEFAAKQPMMSMALAAQVAGKRVRIRYDDANAKILSIALL